MSLRRPMIYLSIFAVMLALTSCGGGGSSGSIVPPPPPPGGGGGGGGGTSPAPVITRLSPSRVVVGVPQGSVTILGSNFTSSTRALLDGVVANSLFVDSSTLELNLDSSISGTAMAHSVQVSDPATGNSNVLTYDVYAPAEGPLPFNGQPTLPFVPNSAWAASVLADVDGDGRSDLITVDADATGSSSRLLVCFGRSDGFVGQSVSVADLGSVQVTQLLPGDLNGDGRVDLVVVAKDSYTAWLNDGSGHFTAAGSGSLQGGNWGRGALGDFNGDGKLDLVVDTGEVPPLQRLLGNGDGTFGTPVLLGSGSEKAARVAAADLNGDGIADLVYATYILGGNDALDMHTVLFHADGSWVDSLTNGVPGPSWSFCVGDFNLDHIPDLFVVDPAGAGQVFAGKGDGTFAAVGSAVYAADGFLVTPPFVAGDFDGDGYPDLATRLTTAIGPDVIEFLWGDGRGNFTNTFIASDQSFYLFTGDVNGDGLSDILASGSFGYTSVVLGRHDRNYPSAKLLLNAPHGQLSAGVVFTGGYHDILVAGDCSSGTAGEIYQLQSNGVPVQEVSTPPCGAVLADLDGDGLADLVGLNAGAVLVWKGDGTGLFQGPVANIPVNGSQVTEDFAFRDMDGDGHTDIVVAGSILYGKGNLQFDPVDLPATLNQRFAVGDFDGDGKLDIAIPGAMLFGEGGRQFTAPTGSAPQCWTGYLTVPAVADLDGDGKDDLLCGSSSPGLLSVYAGVGKSGLLLDQVLRIPAGTVSSVSVGDFNADGRLDIAVGTGQTDDVVLLTGTNSGRYQMSSYAIGVSPILSIADDFNHDGTLDLGFLNFHLDYKPDAIEVLLHK